MALRKNIDLSVFRRKQDFGETWTSMRRPNRFLFSNFPMTSHWEELGLQSREKIINSIHNWAVFQNQLPTIGADFKELTGHEYWSGTIGMAGPHFSATRVAASVAIVNFIIFKWLRSYLVGNYSGTGRTYRKLDCLGRLWLCPMKFIPEKSLSGLSQDLSVRFKVLFFQPYLENLFQTLKFFVETIRYFTTISDKVPGWYQAYKRFGVLEGARLLGGFWRPLVGLVPN